jgi:hypothetical protein
VSAPAPVSGAPEPHHPDGRPARPRRPAGWLPRQHGAWAMLTVPLVAGVWLAGPAPVHLLLAAFWLTGYLAYHAVGRWLRAVRRDRERAPSVTYGGVSLVLGLGLVAAAPHLVWWVPVFVPLLTVSLWWTARGAERSLRNDLVTVLAAGLLTPVAFDAVAGPGAALADPVVWVVTALVTGYFLGTVLYVKTMIRERGDPRYRLASLGYHLAGTVGVAALALAGAASALVVAVWLILVARAAAGPAVNARRTTPLRPVVVGVGEIVLSLAVLVTAFAA